MLNTKALLVFTAFSIIMLSTITAAAPSAPYPVYGFVTDQCGEPLPGASVTLNNTRTEEIIEVTTYSDGGWITDLMDMKPEGYQDQDTINITAEHDGDTGSTQLTVDTSISGPQKAPTIIITKPDETPPSVIPGVDYPPGQSAVKEGDTIDLNVTVTDAGCTGIKNVTVDAQALDSGIIYLSRVDGTDSWSETVTVNISTSGTFYLNVTAYDNADNKNDSEYITVLVDNVPPELSVDFPPEGYETSLNIVTVSGAVNGTGSSPTVMVDSTPAVLDLSGESGTYEANISLAAGDSTITVTAEDGAANLDTANVNVTMTSTPVSGGGDRNPEDRVRWTTITPGKTVEMRISDARIGIDQINIQVSEKLSNVEVAVKRLYSHPSSIPSDPTDEVYRYIEISAENVDESLLDRVGIMFKLLKSWLSQNQYDKNQTSMSRWHNSTWEKLSTTITKEDAYYVYYESISPGLSVFVITAAPAEPSGSGTITPAQAVMPAENATAPTVPIITPTATKTPTLPTITPTATKTPAPTNMPTATPPEQNQWSGLMAAVVFIILIAVCLIVRKLRRP